MKTFLKAVLPLIVIISLSVFFQSCDKQYYKTDKEDIEFKTEVLNEEETLILPTHDYEIHVVQSLEHSYGSQYYTKGVVEYKINQNTVASIDYGNGDLNEHASLTMNSGTTTIPLAKQNSGSVYTKVIVNPIIKTNDCSYIVSGTIKYYDVQTGDLVATIDFGDGTCDKWATKTWPSGSYGGKTWSGGSKTFNMDTWLTK